MYKKTLFVSILFFTAMMITVGYTNAQVCTPDPQYTQPGIYPDSITNLDSGMVGIPYADTITAIVPADTVDGTGFCCNPVDIDSMVITGIGGLPPGLSYQCEPPSCGFPGGTSGCILISGIPTDTGTFNITANVTGYVQCCLVSSGCASCTQIPQSSVVDYYTIVILPALSASITASTDVDCKGNCNGQATVTAIGGAPSYTYLWDDSLAQTTATAASLCAGNYMVIVNDANFDTVLVSVTINEPADSLSATLTSTDETGPGNNDGTAEVAASGGTGAYTYLWSPGGATTDSIGGLAPDTYTVTVTDSNGCTFVGTAIVNPAGCNLLTVTSGTDETCVSCNDGTATMIISSGGTPPYTYIWSTGDTIITTDTVAMIDTLALGPYSVTVTDAGGCSSAGSATVNAYVCTLSIGTISSTDETSAGNKDGTATVIVNGGTPPYTYNWGIDTIVTTDTTSTIVGLAPGNYSVTITDSTGCIRNAGPVTVGAGPVGILPFEGLTNKVLVYPNPVVNELNIIASFDEQVIFTIYDIVGKQIKSVVIESKTTSVNTSEFAEGMYIYRILSKKGIMLNRGKFSIAK